MMRKMSPPRRKAIEERWRALQSELPDEARNRLFGAQMALQHTVERLTQGLGESQRKGRNLYALCPFHEKNLGRPDQNIGSFLVDMRTGFYRCYSCGAHGGIYQLLAELGLSDEEVRTALKDVDFRVLLDFIEGSTRDRREEILPLPESLLNRYLGVPEMYLQRGHSAELLRGMEIGYDLRRERVTFPVRYVTGELVAIQTRATQEDEKYKRWKFYRKEILTDLGEALVRKLDLEDYSPPRRTVFFNEHNVLRGLVEGRIHRPLVLCEGPGHALRVIASGYPAIASFGTQLADGQLPRLLDTLRHLRDKTSRPSIILATDGDRPGRLSAFRTAITLGPTFDIRIAEIPEGHDPEDLKAGELRRLLQSSPEFSTYLRLPTVVGEMARSAVQQHAQDLYEQSQRAERKKRMLGRHKEVEDSGATVANSLHFRRFLDTHSPAPDTLSEEGPATNIEDL